MDLDYTTPSQEIGFLWISTVGESIIEHSIAGHPDAYFNNKPQTVLSQWADRSKITAVNIITLSTALKGKPVNARQYK